MTGLKPYPAYKDSGVEWLGTVPAHWRVVPSKTVFQERKARSGKDDEHLTPSQTFGVLAQTEYMRRTGNRVVLNLSGADAMRHVEPGDYISHLRSFQGGLEYSSIAGKVSAAYTVLSPRSSVSAGYFGYLFKSARYVQALQTTTDQLRDGQSIRFSQFALLALPLPDNEEQVAIANFLDRETAELDAFIADQEQLIALLGERRAATISHAVTKGLDPSLPMKDSGVESLGSIPTTWVASRLKHVAAVQTGLTLGKSVPAGDGIELPYLRVANVQTSGVNLDEVKRVILDRSEWEKYRLRDGDVLMTEGGDIDKLGRGCLWRNEIDPCVHQNHVFAVRCRSTIDRRLLVYILDAPVARRYFRATAKKTTNLASTNSTTLGNLPLALPDALAQSKIVQHLDRETTELDAAISDAREAIVLSKERRAALISAAVTGKIDVRGNVEGA